MKKYILVFVLLFSNVCASAEKFVCNEFIETQQLILGDTGDWLHNNVTVKLTFHQIFLTTNPKDSTYRLRADEEKLVKNLSIETYNLDFYRKSGDSIYIACAYNGTSTWVYKEIPSTLNQCELGYKYEHGDQSNPFIVCK